MCIRDSPITECKRTSTNDRSSDLLLAAPPSLQSTKNLLLPSSLIASDQLVLSQTANQAGNLSSSTASTDNSTVEGDDYSPKVSDLFDEKSLKKSVALDSVYKRSDEYKQEDEEEEEEAVPEDNYFTRSTTATPDTRINTNDHGESDSEISPITKENAKELKLKSSPSCTEIPVPPEEPLAPDEDNRKTMSCDDKEEEDLLVSHKMDLLRRHHHDLRDRFIGRLAHMKVLKPLSASRRNRTICVLDWDDTLCPTTFLTIAGYLGVRQTDSRDFRILDQIVTELIEQILKECDLYLVTNACKGWVESSSKRFLPNTFAALRRNRLQIISARHEFEAKFPGDPLRWKFEAMVRISQAYDPYGLANFIGIGDSVHEIEAIKSMAKKRFINPIVKTVKFCENPKPEDLIRQIQLVLQKFEHIYISERSLTIRLEKM
eukprot:TRINITY_DN1712_c0_g2_i4.p1 TRINITY_DN1712_c0_g2~~TRINITY_DN1712_c0_g2_i4.p1  ORF type:complete len:445 (-),score=101.38 TRINITY_DN1712_c0_g2_i4:354-1649(-)